MKKVSILLVFFLALSGGNVMAADDTSDIGKASEKARDLALLTVAEIYLCRNAPPEDIGYAMMRAKRSIIRTYSSLAGKEYASKVYEGMEYTVEQYYGDTAHSDVSDCSDNISDKLREFENAFAYMEYLSD
ncbi:hypothetical protein [Martelella mangrovi]|uniref:Uncharacterized protein n=1 Tax=Martelella mangrovi TaxID=1397477 RepID=A0ABV2IFV4_9HYPH